MEFLKKAVVLTSGKGHFDVNTDAGKAIYSMALAAASTGKSVPAYGTGQCDDYPNTVEGLLYWHYHK